MKKKSDDSTPHSPIIAIVFCLPFPACFFLSRNDFLASLLVFFAPEDQKYWYIIVLNLNLFNDYLIPGAWSRGMIFASHLCAYL